MHGVLIHLGVDMRIIITLCLYFFFLCTMHAANRLLFLGIGIDNYKYFFNSSWNNSTYNAGDLRSNLFNKGRTDTTRTFITLNLHYFIDNLGVYTNYNIGVINVTFNTENPCTNYFPEGECANVRNNLMRIGSVTEIKLGPAYRLKLGRDNDTILPLELWYSAGLFIQSVELSTEKLERITGSHISSQQSASVYGSIELALFNANLFDMADGEKKNFTFWASLGFQINQSSIALPGERNPVNGVQFSIPLRFGVVF